ncbi:glycosyltransferase [Thiomonas sp. FB-Cd]|uniref:glycosyltransferase n=1 Tax=Thiomonas sp. FB-Cd TaxID=1158292 RepID=UPI0004DF76F3|nr:glycosyltransferase [Thiomonas sp. FB-Cd]
MKNERNEENPYNDSFYQAQQDRSLSSARVILGRVFPMLNPDAKCVLDVGGGVGTWLLAASELGAQDILCIDGDYVDRSMLQINPIYFQAADIANERLGSILARRTRQTFDLTICLEVAEHLPFERAASLVDDLTATADTILFSAALPYQYGVNHINEQWPEFWAILFRAHGYSCYDCLREEIWNHPDVDWWYAQNALLFARNGSAAADRLVQYSKPVVLPLARVHPENFLSNALILHRRHRLSASAEELADYRCIVRSYAARRTIIPRLEAVARASSNEGDPYSAFPYTRTEVSQPEQELAELSAALAEKQRLAVELTETVERLTAQNEQQSVHSAELSAELSAALAEKQRLAVELGAVLSSAAWKATLPIQRAASHLPPPVRRLARGAAKMVWWTLTMKLRQRLAERRRQEVSAHGQVIAALRRATMAAPRAAALRRPSGFRPVLGVARLTQTPGRVLIVADLLPLFDQCSGGLRLKTLIGIMGQSGYRMVFGSFAALDAQPGILASAQGRQRYEEALRCAGVVEILYGIDAIDRFITTSENSLAWAFLSFPQIAARFLPVLRSHSPATRVIYDMVDFHGLRLRREAELRNDEAIREKALQQQAVEVACAEAADLTLAVTEEERGALLALAPEAVVEVLPNVFELPPRGLASPEGRSGLFFVGGFWHAPNNDAVFWFVERIFPELRKAIPDLVLRIAGANAGADVLALGKITGVEVLGFVEDLEPLYRCHRAFVAPLRYGAGMKGKVGQSMAYGLPVVATPVGAEGMGLETEVQVLIAEGESAFVAQVLRLLRDDQLWTRLAVAGREHIEKNYSVDAVRERLGALLRG